MARAAELTTIVSSRSNSASISVELGKRLAKRRMTVLRAISDHHETHGPLPDARDTFRTCSIWATFMISGGTTSPLLSVAMA